MRRFLLAVTSCALAACSVPDKTLASSDAGPEDAALPDVIEDDEAPDTMLTSAPDPFSREANAGFSFSSDESNVTFECSVDGGEPFACTSPYSRGLGNGNHAFSVRAIDEAGNADDTPAEHVWTIDMIAPDTLLLTRPPAADNSVMVTFTFGSGERNVMFDCSLDSGGFTTCVSGATFGPVSDGAHSFAVRARDRAGNIDTSPAGYAWTVDTSTPDTQLVSGPTGATSSTSASFTFVSPDAGAGATFQCAIDGAAFATCTSPRNYASLAMGAHTFSVRVRDAVGNFDPTPATRTWTVDLAAPNTTILTGPNGLESSASAAFTFSANEADVTFACSLDNAPFVACTSPANFTALAQGEHTFAVGATDSAGHPDATPATRTWTVDTVAPDLTITGGPAPGGTSGPLVTFTFTSSDGTVECSIDSGPYAACTSPLELSLPAGSHSIRLRATDAAGNTGATTRSFIVACAAPDGAGASALLHLDVSDQSQPNAVIGGATATLGTDATVELADPSFVVAARFGGGLDFTALDGDHVTWPVALGASGTLSLELWARPDSAAGTRALFESGDGRVMVRITAVSPTTVRFSFTVLEADATVRTVSSAVVAAAQWHHVVASLQEPTLRLWVDGERTELAGVTLGLRRCSTRSGSAVMPARRTVGRSTRSGWPRPRSRTIPRHAPATARCSQQQRMIGASRPRMPSRGSRPSPRTSWRRSATRCVRRSSRRSRTARAAGGRWRCSRSCPLALPPSSRRVR
ncbi:MAG: LamG-like jellyroll fold domain-containing protein [Kofleriaceae bacterium]